MKKLFYILFISLFIFSCDDSNPSGPLCNDVIEVELWGECYNIDETTSIYISYDKIVDSVPEEISLFENLTSLSISDTELSVIPSFIFDLINLETLNLMYNKIEEIPSEINNLTNLEYLYLRGNPITELPPEIGNLSNLLILYIENTLLTTFPTEIGQLINLRNLQTGGFVDSEYGLTSIPESFYNLVNLEVLGLSHNQLVELPNGISNLNSLSQLNLTGNNLKSLPDDLCNLPNIWSISVSGNNLCEYYDFSCVNVFWSWSQDQTNCCEGPDSQENWVECPEN